MERIRWGRPARVSTARGVVEADYVILAGNAYLGDRIEPRIGSRIMPIVNYVLATEPLGERRARALIRSGACVHATKFVVDYYRCTADHRLLFGGGETWSDRPLDDPKAFVRRYMLRVFPQLADVRVDYAWSGRLAITMNRLPHVGRLAPNGFFAHGFSGHGVALTQIAGKLIAEAVAGTAERFDVLAGAAAPGVPGRHAASPPAAGPGDAVLCAARQALKTRTTVGRASPAAPKHVTDPARPCPLRRT